MNLRERGGALWQRAEGALDRVVGGGTLNPLRHLGALAFLCFWLLAISGIYVYAVLDTSATGAYGSIDALSRDQWFLGGWLRSLHRYAADAFVVTMLAHLLREWLLGRYSGFRRFSWLTGVPLLPLAFASAIGGFWLNWDKLGQFSAIATAEFIDWLPFFASPLTRNFLGVASVSDRLFSLFVFVHLGVPLLIVFAMWFHIQRVAHAEVFPPRRLAIAATAMLIALAFALPVLSQGPADLAVAPGALALDWWLLFIHPLVYATSAGAVWLLLALTLVALFALPFIPQPAAAPVAEVDPANCSGCRRCFDDCPYTAITMIPHPNRRIGYQMAQVDADLCASCGICVGACPSSTPFRKSAKLVTGIDMPQSPINALRERMEAALERMPAGAPKWVVFGCDQGANVARLGAPDVAAFSLICTGMLPPSFIEYALRGGVDGVLVTGCSEGGCAFRLGQRWTRERLLGAREPHLRASVPRERVATVWADVGEEATVEAALAALRLRVSGATPPTHARLRYG
ncbi:MAG: hydrogenase iron-sulfur subunit [Rhizobacter sp.]|nr:hydrogenase iron-sulfur subunit [Rhizobacter sp.]